MIAVIEYYSHSEIAKLFAEGEEDELFFIDLDRNRALVPYVAKALEIIPKATVDWLLSHSAIGLRQRIEYLGSERWSVDALWGCCDPWNDIFYAIDISPNLLEQSEAIIVTTIMHEYAHAVCGHNQNGSKEEHEKEADGLVEKWMDDYVEYVKRKVKP